MNGVMKGVVILIVPGEEFTLRRTALRKSVHDAEVQGLPVNVTSDRCDLVLGTHLDTFRRTLRSALPPEATLIKSKGRGRI